MKSRLVTKEEVLALLNKELDNEHGSRGSYDLCRLYKLACPYCANGVNLRIRRANFNAYGKEAYRHKTRGAATCRAWRLMQALRNVPTGEISNITIFNPPPWATYV